MPAERRHEPPARNGPLKIDAVAQDGVRRRLIAAPDGEPAFRPGGVALVHDRLVATSPA